jgi:hypothetical protein
VFAVHHAREIKQMVVILSNGARMLDLDRREVHSEVKGDSKWANINSGLRSRWSYWVNPR